MFIAWMHMGTVYFFELMCYMCVYVLRPRLWLNIGVSVPVQCFSFCYATAAATVLRGREKSPGAELSECSSETPRMQKDLLASSCVFWCCTSAQDGKSLSLRWSLFAFQMQPTPHFFLGFAVTPVTGSYQLAASCLAGMQKVLQLSAFKTNANHLFSFQFWFARLKFLVNWRSQNKMERGTSY